MGAHSFSLKAKGKSLQDAYESAHAEARHEHGSDAYNGTISTTHGVSDYTSQFKRSGKSVNQFIDAYMDKAEKWGNCIGICVKEPKGNKNKIKSQVDHVVTKGTKKWVLKFVVTTGWHETKEIAVKNTKGEALKVARAHTEKTQESTEIHMEKRLEGCSTKVANVKYKKATNEQDGEYIIFGWAAC